MRWTKWVVRLGFGLSVLVGYALAVDAEKPAAKDGEKALAFMVCGGVDRQTADRARAFMIEQFEIEVRELDPAPASSASLAEIAADAAKRMTPEALYLIVLADAPESVKETRLVQADRRVAVLNAHALRPRAVATKEVAEAYGRRLEKECMRAVASLAGVPACPFPHCALFDHVNEQQLDAKSRNPCPPCLVKTQALLIEKGAKSKPAPRPEVGARPKRK